MPASRIGASRIGDLSPFSPRLGLVPAYETFRNSLRELGYVERRNLTVEYRWTEGRNELLPVMADELVRASVDVIFAYGTPAALALKKATSTIPVVVVVADAVGAGLVASLSRPGANITGATFISEETIGKQVEMLKALVPRITRVGVVVNLANPVYGPILKASAAPARTLGLQLEVLSVQAPGDFEGI